MQVESRQLKKKMQRDILLEKLEIGRLPAEFPEVCLKTFSAVRAIGKYRWRTELQNDMYGRWTSLKKNLVFVPPLSGIEHILYIYVYVYIYIDIYIYIYT